MPVPAVPGEAPLAPRKLTTSSRDYRPLEILGTPIFWILYAMFVLVAASGLVVTAQVAPIARDFKIASLPVNFLFVSSTVIPRTFNLDEGPAAVPAGIADSSTCTPMDKSD